DGETLLTRKVILAMGIKDREPDITGISDHVGRFLRYCPVCDGYEHTDKRLGILGSGPAVARHALFLRSFSNCITLFLHGEDPASLEEYATVLAKKHIDVQQSRITRILEEEIEGEKGCRGTGVRLEDGSEHPLEALYISLGCNVNLGPVAGLPINVDEDGFVITDAYQETSVPGIYAAGDLVSQLSQISVAFGQAAVAAVRIHNELDDSEDEDDVVTSQIPGTGVE
ncbi:MAG: NAD(P)/FAD-dependent oxidoreductase, partial [Armatimonadota bacterium]|nr:NAD(P)/FAD-dependent oxidoreductase [Armatimonadota bacterium]